MMTNLGLSWQVRYQSFVTASLGDKAALLPTSKPVEDMGWNPKHLVFAFTGGFQDGSSVGGRSSSRSGNYTIYAPK